MYRIPRCFYLLRKEEELSLGAHHLLMLKETYSNHVPQPTKADILVIMKDLVVHL
jgi:hypothetical protein